jgi:hypothetical protein
MAQMKKACIAVDDGEHLMSRWAPVITLALHRQRPVILHDTTEAVHPLAPDNMARHFKNSVVNGDWCTSWSRSISHKERLKTYWIYAWGHDLISTIRFYANSIVEKELAKEFVKDTVQHEEWIQNGGVKLYPSFEFKFYYKESLKELQRCDHWIAELEKIQSMDLFAYEMVGVLTGSMPAKDAYQFTGVIDPAIFAFLYSCAMHRGQHWWMRAFSEEIDWLQHAFPEWDGPEWGGQ